MRIIIIIIALAPFQAWTFQQSKEVEMQDELQYCFDYYPGRWENKEDVRPDLEAKFASNIYQSESMNSSVVRSNNPKRKQMLQDALDTFNALKIKMNISDEVQLYFLRGHITINGTNIEEEAVYDGHDRRVYISNNLFGRAPARILFTLMHELTHVQQHQRLGLREYKLSSSYDKEHEADTNAILAISCPVCAQLIEDEWPKDNQRTALGYLSRADIGKYKEKKCNNQLCKAHAADSVEAQKLRALMPSQLDTTLSWNEYIFGKKDKNIIERLELDLKLSRTAEDRLSSVKFDTKIEMGRK